MKIRYMRCLDNLAKNPQQCFNDWKNYSESHLIFMKFTNVIENSPDVFYSLVFPKKLQSTVSKRDLNQLEIVSNQPKSMTKFPIVSNCFLPLKLKQLSQFLFYILDSECYKLKIESFDTPRSFHKFIKDSKFLR